MPQVNVATYRQDTDHLYRIANVDWHACVNATEREHWAFTATRALERTNANECMRAKHADGFQRDKARQALQKRLEEYRQTSKPDLNSWWLQLPEAQQAAILNDDRWCLARAAFDAGMATVKKLTDAALDPDTLEAIASEIEGDFKHTARAGSLRVLAREQRLLLNRKFD